MRIKMCSTTLVYGRIANTVFWIQDAPSIDIHSDHEVCYARGPFTGTLTNSFLLLGVVTCVPLLAKIDQEMRVWECRQTDRQTDRHAVSKTNWIYNLSHSIVYAIAMGQVKTGCWIYRYMAPPSVDEYRLRNVLSIKQHWSVPKSCMIQAPGRWGLWADKFSGFGFCCWSKWVAFSEHANLCADYQTNFKNSFAKIPVVTLFKPLYLQSG